MPRARDVAHLRRVLVSVEREAAELDWAGERPWRAETHVWGEGDLPTIDLHDLNARLAGQVVAAVAAEHADLEVGAVRFIVGRGRHSRTPPVLAQVTGRELRAAFRARGPGPAVSAPFYRPEGGGRIVAVFDPARAPASAKGAMGWWFWLLIAAFVAAAVTALLLGPR